MGCKLRIYGVKMNRHVSGGCAGMVPLPRGVQLWLVSCRRLPFRPLGFVAGDLFHWLWLFKAYIAARSAPGNRRDLSASIQCPYQI